MLRKLIKFELKSGLNIMYVIWLGLLASSTLLGIVMKMNRAEILNNIFIGISGTLFGGLFIATIIATAMVILLRFYNGLLGDEGYLMHTLPVSTHKLVLAKGISASIVTLISTIIAAISISILAVTDFSIKYMVKDIVQGYKDYPKAILLTLLILLLIIISTMVAIYKIYLAMSIGQLFNSKRGLISLLAYIGIGVVEAVIINILGYVVDFERLQVNNANQAIGLFSALCVIVFVMLVIYHFIVATILSKKLNLL